MEASLWHCDGITEPQRGDADIASVASLIAEPARARVLTALADGRALPASRLAAEAGLSPQATSTHLAKLRTNGFVEVESSGRNRYYRLADHRISTALEALAAIAPTHTVRSLRQGTRAAAMRAARSCYDHLAGRVGVTVTEALLRRGALTSTDGVAETSRRAHDPLSKPLPQHPYQLGPAAADVLAELGVDLPALLDAPRSARPLLRFCLDWSEQRHHLGGRLGAALFSSMQQQGWLHRPSGQRAVRLTESGANMLQKRLDLDLDCPGS